MYTVFYISWSPVHGEATYSRCFDTPEDREAFSRRLDPRASIQTWEKLCQRR